MLAGYFKNLRSSALISLRSPSDVRVSPARSRVPPAVAVWPVRPARPVIAAAGVPGREQPLQAVRIVCRH